MGLEKFPFEQVPGVADGLEELNLKKITWLGKAFLVRILDFFFLPPFQNS